MHKVKYLIIIAILVFTGFNNHANAALDCASVAGLQNNRCVASDQPKQLFTMTLPLTYDVITTGTPNPCCRKKCTTNASFVGTDCACDASFHTEDAISCESNTGTCGAGLNGTGVKVWDTDLGEWGACALDSCNAGYHLTSQKTCITNSPACSGATIGLTGATGNATWTGTTYDKSNCAKSQSVSTTNGTGLAECLYTSGNGAVAVFDLDCEIKSITSCNTGYWYNTATPPSPLDCQLIEKGYYAKSAANNKDKLPCPGGTTSDGGAKATKKSDCFIKGGTGGTKFCDNNGCFNLPTNVRY